jgi:hypothetical protein
MKAYASQILVDTTGKVLRNAVVLSNPATNTLYCADIFDGQHERANTLFFDGIISLHTITDNASVFDDSAMVYHCEENELLPDTFRLTEQTVLHICLQRPESLSDFIHQNYAVLHPYPIPLLVKSMLLQVVADVKTANMQTIAFLWQHTHLTHQLLSPETVIRPLGF